jgi:large subunit ribosomal protein L7/L12
MCILEKEEKEEVEVPEKFKDLVDEIANLSVLELSELVSVLEDKFGVSAAAPAVAAAPAAANGGDQEEEKSDYDVELKSIGQKKIEVIKAVRDITGKGLKDAKALVDSAADSPQTIKEGVPTEKANEIKEKLEEAGAEVELK